MHVVGVMTLRRYLLVTALVLVAACGGDGGDDSSSTTTTSAPEASSTTAPDAEAEVLDAYRSFWDAYLAAGDPMDPAHPDLERYATGASLERVRESFARHFANGEVIRGTVELSPEVERSSADSATVRDCYLDRTHLFDSATGEQVDPPGEVTFQVVAELVRDGGAWKVATLDQVGEGCER